MRQASLLLLASNQHGRALDSVTLSTASRCGCASVLTMKQFIASSAFVKSPILIWQSRFCAEEISDGMQACLSGPFPQSFANLTVTHQNWPISFHNFGRPDI